MLIHVQSEAQFEQEINSQNKTLVDFYADWCGPCKMIAPILEVIAEERNDINVLKINVDELPRIAGRFGITSIPTLMVFLNGQLLQTSLGYKAKSQIENLLK